MSRCLPLSLLPSIKLVVMMFVKTYTHSIFELYTKEKYLWMLDTTSIFILKMAVATNIQTAPTQTPTTYINI
jgi:hypothetical protein